MARHRFIREQFIQCPLDDVFAFHADASNLGRITPPWLNFRIVTPLPITMTTGALIDYEIRLRGLPVKWRSKIAEWNPPHSFMDVQLRGPYRVWEHRHEFHVIAGGTVVRDTVDYELPGGWLGEIVHRWVVSRDIAKIFEHRRAAMTALLTAESSGASGGISTSQHT